MCRCEERGLTDNDDGLTTDPDWVDDRLRDLQMMWQGGSSADTVWHHTMEKDPYELEKLRRKQKVYLAKYIHTPPGYWDDKDVNEIQDYIAETSELIKEENQGKGGH